MQTWSALPLLVIGCLAFGCAAAPPPPAAPPPAASAPPASPPPAKVPEAAAVPAPPEACAAYTAAPVGCDDTGKLASRIADALAESESLTRDRRLACIEVNAGPISAVVRALRADLAPLACADALVVPYLEQGAALAPDDEAALLGLLVAGKLSRLVAAPPALEPPIDKPRFQAYFEEQLKPWVISQALAIGKLSVEGSKLRGYGKAVAAIEAGLADLRFVQMVRQVPLPNELANDVETKNAYFGALDEALEPRKVRGRDAALVGLKLFAELGALGEPRVLRARVLLSELYGGGRLDALDRLLLPGLPPLRSDTVEQKLAARLPTYYAHRFLGDVKDPTDPALLRAFAERGLPSSVRARLDSEKLQPATRLIYAQLELARGALYFSSTAFARAAELAGSQRGDPTAEFVTAIGRSLDAAPRDAIQLMLASPRLSGPLGTAEPLAKIATAKGRYAGEAEFDGAYVASLSSPDNDAKFWSDLALRFGNAAKALKGRPGQSLAEQHASAARMTAEAIKTEATKMQGRTPPP